MKERWIFTFGVEHPFARFYWTGEGTFEEAREAMVARFGYGFDSQYPEEEGLRIARKHGLSDMIIGKKEIHDFTTGVSHAEEKEL